MRSRYDGPTVCIPPPLPDLDCGDIPHRRFTVIGADPHRFDADRTASAARARRLRMQEPLEGLPWQQQVDAICSAHAFNHHPMDWERFNHFICRMFEAGSIRPDVAQLGERLAALLPATPDWQEDLLIAYEQGLELLKIAWSRWGLDVD